jgi:hypothetical protein
VEVCGDAWEPEVLQVPRPPFRGQPTHLLKVAMRTNLSTLNASAAQTEFALARPGFTPG